MVTQWKLFCRKITNTWPHQLVNARPKKPPTRREQAYSQTTVRTHRYAAETLRAKDLSTIPTPTCSGCGGTAHPAGHSQCPTYSQICFCCQNVDNFAKVCQSRAPKHNSHPTPTQAPVSTPNVKCLTISNIQSATVEKAPLIKVHIISANGSSESEVLPDSWMNTG